MSSADKLTIETPEQTSLEFPLAGIGSRFVALLLDFLLQIAVYIVLGIIAASFASANVFRDASKTWVFAVLLFVAFAVQFGYFATFETLWNGQTPGKRWMKIRVIKDSGRPISAYDAILRNLLRLVDALPSLYATGVVCMLISPENKRVGDYAAGTVVIHEQPMVDSNELWKPGAEPAAALPLQAVARLTDEELRVVESFLERRNTLEPNVRWGLARQIADRLALRLQIPAESRPPDEKFLEALAEQRRNTARFR